MDFFCLIAAGVFSLLTCLIHLFVGGRFIARPLLDATDLRRFPKVTAYYAWHLVTVMLLAMSCGFSLAAAVPGQRTLVSFWRSLLGGASILNFGMMLYFKQKPTRLIQWVFFVPITILAVLALMG
jgi:hypothetical protein